MTLNQNNSTQPTPTEELRTIFAEHGLRTTRQREAVYQMLCACKSHPTADELLALVHTIDPEVSQATIYNTLEILVGCRLARRIPNPSSGGACRYDANTAEHVHLVLEDGRVMDVPTDLSEKILDAMPASILEELNARIGVGLKGIRVELLGL